MLIVSPVLLAVVGIIDGIFSGGRQISDWLRTGVWTPDTLRSGLARFGIDAPTLDWVIPQRMLDWFLDMPRMIGMPIAAVLFAAVYLTTLIWAMGVGDRFWKHWFPPNA